MTELKDLFKICKRLTLRESFYGILLLSINKLVNGGVPTAAVGLDKINKILMINPEFWNDLSDNHKLGVLQHEMCHLALFHLETRSQYPDKILANIAMDCLVNQLVKRELIPGAELSKQDYDELLDKILKKKELLMGKVEAGHMTKEEAISQLPKAPMRPVLIEDFGFTQADEFKGTKFYYDYLKSQLGTNLALDNLYNAMNEGIPTVCSHDSWDKMDKLPQVTKDLIKSQTEAQVKQAAKQYGEKNIGNLPGELREILEELLKETTPIIDWRSYFRLFAGGSSKTEVKKTRRRPSHRYPDAPRIKIVEQKHILFAVDTSGSMSQEELQECFNELGHISKSGSAITVVECDTKIGRIYPFNKKGDQGTKITGGGGTSFQPVIDYYNDNRHVFSTLIYFTDGYAYVPSPAPLKSMLWVLSSGNDYGSKTVDQMNDEGFIGSKIKMIKDW